MYVTVLERREGVGVLDVQVLGLRLLPVTVAAASTPTTSSIATSTCVASTTTSTYWALEMGVDINILLRCLLAARFGSSTLGLLVERGQRGGNYEGG